MTAKMAPADALAEIRNLESARNAALERLAETSPFARRIGVRLERLGGELSMTLPFDPKLIGNPVLPALHGGVIGAFLEHTALSQLAWDEIWERLETGGVAREDIQQGRLPAWPRTIDLTIDYLRSGRARDVFARAVVAKRGRRISNVRVEAWQERRDRPIAAAHGHFLLPDAVG
ncbi:MAG: PaaI family thioesterase [Rhodobacteraceae bacterium]|nr:PaaI family thioesterase [Paracoccaceae bacterium]